MQRTEAANKLWHSRYRELRKARPDGPAAKMLARAVPQVLRLSLAYALADGRNEIDEPHLSAALALWSYAEATAEWMFGVQIDTAKLDDLVAYIASAGPAGRTRTEISCDHFAKNRKAEDITAMLGQLVADGRVREEIDEARPGRSGRRATRYYA